jgi:hypothetical protein
MAEIMEEENICAMVANQDELPLADNDEDETREKLEIAPVESESDVE